MESRLIQIEEKIAHLEHHLSQLDGVVREAHERMDQFRRQIDGLQAKIQTIGYSASEPGGHDEPGSTSDQQLRDDRPPHW